jgi:tetratricopeptide (TPR) repeat protein
VSPTTRIRLLVGAAAVVAAGVVAGVVYATRQDPPQPKALCGRQPAAQIVPGVATAFAGEVRAAMKEPPRAAARILEPIAQEHPKDAVVQYNDGLALYCAGYLAEASQAFRQAKTAGRDTYYEVVSDNLLHPQLFHPDGGGYPPFQYSGRDRLLIEGQIAQRQFHQRTAERLWERAARAHPDDPEAQVAAAVGRFDEDDLAASFSRLGPLVQRFPKSQSVRFHLGLLSAWTGQRDTALREFRLARDLGPRTKLGRAASEFVGQLVASGTNGSKR